MILRLFSRLDLSGTMTRGVTASLAKLLDKWWWLHLQRRDDAPEDEDEDTLPMWMSTGAKPRTERYVLSETRRNHAVERPRVRNLRGGVLV